MKTGRYSKLPVSLADRFERAASDPDLLAMRDDVALIDARLSQLLDQAGTGESAAAWARVQKAHENLLKAEASRNPEKKNQARFELQSAVERGGTDMEVWAEIGSHIEGRRKLVESERKRLIEMQQMVRADQAMAFVAAVMASVREHVHDRDTLSRISADISRLVHQDVAGRSGAASAG